MTLQGGRISGRHAADRARQVRRGLADDPDDAGGRDGARGRGISVLGCLRFVDNS